MQQDTDLVLDQIMVDGGISSNNFVVQFLADLLGRNVVNIGIQDVSALGAAYLAGLKKGIFKSIEQLSQLHTQPKIYRPANNLSGFYRGWQKAIKEK